MAWYHKLFNINENIDAFKKVEDSISQEKSTGEGLPANVPIEGFGNVGLSSFNVFYNNYINKTYSNEIDRLMEYRRMAETSEISDIIEDATNEAIQLNSDNKVINFDIIDKKLTENDNIIKNIYNEYVEVFEKRIDLRNILWDMFHTYMIDGKVYYERIIDEKNPKKGIIGIKKLPTETMDFVSDPKTGKIIYFFQYLKNRPRKPSSYEEAIKLQEKGDLIVFNPSQIGYINYGVYSNTIHQVRGFLEKARIPFNQLKLLETSVVIYRIVRAPERLVFKIDTGNMPRDKSLKFVEKIKQKMTKKQTYNPTTGTLSNEPDIMCIRKNTEIPLLDGRYLTLDEIIREHNEGKENWVYTINQKTLNIEPGKIKHAKITRKNEKLIRVWFDNGSYIDTTYDHKFILRDGSECRADELKINQSLMPLYKRIDKKVLKIEYLQENDDTGCIEVEGNHNFAVSQNSQPLVFIRNSMLENFYLPQCLRISNTYIDLLDGEKISLKQLIDEHNEGKKHEVYSVDQKTGKIIRGKVKWAGVTRKNAEIVRVHLDNNEYVDVTPDHKFVLRDGSECRADELKPNQSLMPLYMKFEKINVLYVEKLDIKEDTGCLTIEDPGENHNFALSVGVFVKNSADGRGSDVTSIGGNPAGFSELEDIYYFSRKLYRALKYPLSRITAGQEKREADIVFGGSQTSEISRDEIKWAKFLERQQSKFSDSLLDTFLIHLAFTGLKKQYGLSKSSFELYLNRPSHYKEQMDQMFLETRFNNYQIMADRQEFSKYYLMKKYLKWSDDEIMDNVKYKEYDKTKLGIKEEESSY